MVNASESAPGTPEQTMLLSLCEVELVVIFQSDSFIAFA